MAIRIKPEKRHSFFNFLVVFLVVWCAMQDFFLPILLQLTGAVGFVKVLFYSKDVLLIILFIYAFFKTKGIKTSYAVLSLTFMAVAFIYIFVGLAAKVEASMVLASFRGWILLPCLFYIGYAIDNKPHFLKKTLPRIFRFYVLLAIFGLVEYYLDKTIGTKKFWTDTVGITEYMDVIKGQKGRLVEGLPGNFYGSYGEKFLSQKRVCSVWASPLAAGYNFLLPISYYFSLMIKKPKLKYAIGFGICFWALWLTKTRAIVLLCVPVFLLLMFHFWAKARILILIVTVVGGIAFFALFQEKIMGYLFDQSTGGHTESIILSLQSIDSFLGTGLGTYGVGTAIGTESTFITCYGQLGVLGIILYVWLILAFVTSNLRMVSCTGSAVVVSICVPTACLFLTGLISEQIIAYTSSVLAFILMGAIACPRRVKVYRYVQNYNYQRVYQ